MKYSVLIEETVQEQVIKSYLDFFSSFNPVERKIQIYYALETLKEIFRRLSNNPFKFPLVTKKSRFIIDTYMFLTLVYKIEDNKIIVFSCYERVELIKTQMS